MQKSGINLHNAGNTRAAYSKAAKKALPSRADLVAQDAPEREKLLKAHAFQLYVEAVQHLAPRHPDTVLASRAEMMRKQELSPPRAKGPASSGPVHQFDAVDWRKARRSLRDRLRRLWDRADEFGIDVGQALKPDPIYLIKDPASSRSLLNLQLATLLKNVKARYTAATQ